MSRMAGYWRVAGREGRQSGARAVWSVSRGADMRSVCLDVRCMRRVRSCSS